MVRRVVVCNIWSHALEFWVGKTHPLLMVKREVVCNILSLELEFEWVILPPC